jgi:hypothetical protein
VSTRNGTIVSWGLLAVLAGGLIARPAVATDEDTFNKLIAKVAPTFVSGQKITPRVACACPNDGSSTVGAGFVLNDGGNIVCALPSFVSGTLFNFAECHNFAVLGH